MAPGSEPDTVIELAKILEPHVYGLAMAGAGGGGFLYAITKEPDSKSKIQQLLNESDLKDVCLYDARVSNDGIEFKFI
jgi:fucokinase